MTIKSYDKNSAYWQYKGKPILLLGGSSEDNPFQWTGDQLIENLDLLVSVGGNYIRNTMSDRDEGNVYPFKKNADNIYNLSEWNNEYWKRLTAFLEETNKRGIIVQFTLWDQWDLFTGNHYDIHPWNPVNNINYTADIMPAVDDFYNSVKENKQKLLIYQKEYIDKILSISLKYDHLLYNINNESWTGKEWESYWADFILNKAESKGVDVQITSMHRIPESSIRTVMENKDRYSYTDISQLSQDAVGKSGQAHMDFILKWRAIMTSYLGESRPVNNIKVYGADKGENIHAGTAIEAAERFWRNIFGGCAAVRFHRNQQHWGLGLTQKAQNNIKSMRMLVNQLDIYSCQPHNELLVQEEEREYSLKREDNEAYCLANIGSQYAVYFPAGGMVNLDPWINTNTDKMKIKWLDINNCSWTAEREIDVNWDEEFNVRLRSRVRLVNPENKPKVALLEV